MLGTAGWERLASRREQGVVSTLAAGPEAGPREEGASAVMARSEASVARRLSRVMGLSLIHI